MDESQAKRRIYELRELIERHERLYRIENAPQISDDDFDALMRELRALESEFPRFFDKDSPSQKIGTDLSQSFISREHLSPMLSLDNVFNIAELRDFDFKLKKVLGFPENAKLPYCIEPKIDGAGISAVYENGTLKYLLTRGNGERGDDITKNSSVFKNLPSRLEGDKIPKLLEIRGEGYMTLPEFEKIRANARTELERKFRQKFPDETEKPRGTIPDGDTKNIEKSLPANPRNLAAGTMKLLDAKILATRSLMAVFYSVGKSEGFELDLQSSLPDELDKLGLPHVDWHERASGTEEVFEKISELEELRNEFDFNTDGAVVKLDDVTLHSRAGSTSHAPRWAVAWKYRAERASTRLKSITEQVGRTGTVTPVAELEPVRISGSTVSRATLHNAGYIASKDIRAGDVVIVEKAGEIIPAVVGVDTSKRPADSVPYEFPEYCPECGSKLRRFGEKMLYRCPNLACPPQVRGRLEHFASRDCMDIRGMGRSVVEKLVDTCGIKDPSDIYKLTIDDILKLDKFAEKSAENLLASIEESKNRDLWRLVFGLGILEIGEQFAKALAKKFGSLDNLMKAGIDEIKSLEGFGGGSKKKSPDILRESQPVRALSVRAFFDDPHNIETIEKLRVCGLRFENSEKIPSNPGNSPFHGRTFAITGKLESMGRNRAKALIEEFGGKVSSTVSASTDFVVSDGKSTGNKMKNALVYGTKILSEDDFLKMLSTARNAANPEAPGTDAFKSTAGNPISKKTGGFTEMDDQPTLF